MLLSQCCDSNVQLTMHRLPVVTIQLRIDRLSKGFQQSAHMYTYRYVTQRSGESSAACIACCAIEEIDRDVRSDSE